MAHSATRTVHIWKIHIFSSERVAVLSDDGKASFTGGLQNGLHLLGSDASLTWRHSWNSWGLRSELPAVRARAHRPPSPLQWAIDLSSRSPCCGWWTRPSEPTGETAQSTRVHTCYCTRFDWRNIYSGVRKGVSALKWVQIDLPTQFWHRCILTMAQQHDARCFYFWKLKLGDEWKWSNSALNE